MEIAQNFGGLDKIALQIHGIEIQGDNNMDLFQVHHPILELIFTGIF